MHEVLVNRLGGLSLPRKSVVRLTDRPDMTLDVYRGRKNNSATRQRVFLPKEYKKNLGRSCKTSRFMGCFGIVLEENKLQIIQITQD